MVKEHDPQSGFNKVHLDLCPAKFGVLLDPSVQESHSWHSMPASWARASCLQLQPLPTAAWLCPTLGPKGSWCCPWDNYGISFDSLERKNIVKCKSAVPFWLKWTLLFLPVCLKHSFCSLEILHIIQSVMISLSLAVSLLIEVVHFADFLLSFQGKSPCCIFE